jgi:hypothetical protein
MVLLWRGPRGETVVFVSRVALLEGGCIVYHGCAGRAAGAAGCIYVDEL